MKDAQRRRLYRAERQAFALLPKQPLLTEHAQLEDAVRGIEASDWYREIWPRLGPIARIHSQRHRGGRAHYTPYERSLYFARPTDLWVVCHEMAHHVTWNPYPSHGIEFCQAYLTIVRHVIDMTAADFLQDCMDRNKVSYAHNGKTSATVRTRVRTSGLSAAQRGHEDPEQGRKYMSLLTHDRRRLAGYMFLDNDLDTVIVRLDPKRWDEDPRDGSVTEIPVKSIAYLI